eukprot:3067775-Rhodomonas_salina.2
MSAESPMALGSVGSQDPMEPPQNTETATAPGPLPNTGLAGGGPPSEGEHEAGAAPRLKQPTRLRQPMRLRQPTRLRRLNQPMRLGRPMRLEQPM